MANLAFPMLRMLRYDTVKDNTWHGYLMIVTTDEGSDYDPIQPSALLEWDATPGGGFEHFQQYKPEEESDESVNRRHINGIRIFTYHSLAGPQSFWRFKLEIPLPDREEEVFYSINVRRRVKRLPRLRLTQLLHRMDKSARSGCPLATRTSDVSRAGCLYRSHLRADFAILQGSDTRATASQAVSILLRSTGEQVPDSSALIAGLIVLLASQT